MKKLAQIIISLISIFIINNAICQNLVQNHSFELIDSCPPGHFMAGGDPWVVQNWNIPPGSITTPDLFSTCYNGTTPIFPHFDVSVPKNFMGYAYPQNGNNYMGFLLKYGQQTGGEYLQTQLLNPLITDQKYLCGFYIQKADSSYYAIDKVGMHISSVQESQTINQPMVNLSPQIYNTTGIMYDSINWLKIENIYTAVGGEKFITIGNFYDNLTTQSDSITTNTNQYWLSRGYYLLDNVYIIPYDENISIQTPETSCKGQTISLKANGASIYSWYINDVWYSKDSIISLELFEDTKIMVVGYYDTLLFEIKVIDCPIDCSGIPIIPNVFTPNNDGINDLFYPKELNKGCYSITILNRWGNVIFESDEMLVNWGGKTQNGLPVSDGVYFYIIKTYDNLANEKTYYGHVSVIR